MSDPNVNLHLWKCVQESLGTKCLRGNSMQHKLPLSAVVMMKGTIDRIKSKCKGSPI